MVAWKDVWTVDQMVAVMAVSTDEKVAVLTDFVLAESLVDWKVPCSVAKMVAQLVKVWVEK